MKGAIAERTGLLGFIKNFVAARKTFSTEQIENGLMAGEKEMLQNGIVAVGDISNAADSFPQKAKRNLKYYTFIEAFDFLPLNAEKEFERARSVAGELEKIFPDANFSIVPHAPYSVSEQLFQQLALLPSPQGEGLGVRAATAQPTKLNGQHSAPNSMASLPTSINSPKSNLPTSSAPSRSSPTPPNKPPSMPTAMLRGG